MNFYSTDQGRWEALETRDPQADGAFLYGVTTTGIYCRPTCSSKLPNRDNVRFFDTWNAAEGAGFRPCKRCEPRSTARPDRHREIVLQACRMMETSLDACEGVPTLAELADAAGLSPSYFHRVFKRIVGVTPKQYAMERRLRRVRASLQESPTVTDAIYEAGFASNSRFYEEATATLGMKPSTYQKGGAGVRIRFTIAQCYLGWVLVGATDLGVCAIDLDDAPEALIEGLRARFPGAEFVEGDPEVARWATQLLAFLEAPEGSLDLPLDVMGTAFQRRVWTALREVAPGSTVTYGEIAARIGSPKAARAVAQACASNELAIAVPCHRVVRSDGQLGGYRWGSGRKRKLLEREAETADE
jgi:AraC family transcriptional regulator of adaptative response/methylated-DNA-[protein]-cysteine methyltransferase